MHAYERLRKRKDRNDNPRVQNALILFLPKHCNPCYFQASISILFPPSIVCLPLIQSIFRGFFGFQRFRQPLLLPLLHLLISSRISLSGFTSEYSFESDSFLPLTRLSFLSIKRFSSFSTHPIHSHFDSFDFHLLILRLFLPCVSLFLLTFPNDPCLLKVEFFLSFFLSFVVSIYRSIYLSIFLTE
ncbi:unnamed protein product [Acanthosepion pharaonis]|uniref:Uncharacterized protein n=1 Tax=Acanthosepion pharaonis TaxID=158019 RepID=A0A812C9B0_ACAPH|nr:unnamed protein product [Sepia pharaonis]